MNAHAQSKAAHGARRRSAFSVPDLLVTLGTVCLVSLMAYGAISRHRGASRRAQCLGNVKQITHAVIQYANEHEQTFPALAPNSPTNVWWYYKEMVKGYAGLSGPPSPQDRLFTCPDDRGYDSPTPFHSSPKFYYSSYVFNGVTLPGVPHLAGLKMDAVQRPSRTLLVMEWTAHGPISWHDSRTGRKNHPFYNDALNVTGFVDGGAKYIPIYYDGINAAYTRDPIPGYEYQYSPDATE